MRYIRQPDEQDAFSRYWRSRVFWQKGELKKIKRGFNKRVRRDGKTEIKEQRNE